ncbi:MAG: 4-alpha-glucanotransferase [Myxococcales bacterium]|nr:4-alpha-glucanotransferase [Myxococcales bacterium]
MRQSGLLLHPTSLPGPEGIGTLGAEARRFIDALERAGQRCWQLLPLNPTGLYNSPYMTSSALAGNPLLIDLESCVEAGWLERAALADAPVGDLNRVDFATLLPWKEEKLAALWQGFKANASEAERAALAAFREAEGAWLEEFALFVVLGDAHDGAPWTRWAPELRDRDPEALEAAREAHADAIDAVCFEQHLFFEQWTALKGYANARDVSLIGDIPIFVSHNSADVWVHRAHFFLDEAGEPTVVAGVPPDYFSATGQRWGNPLYRWDRMAEDGFAWWVERFRICFRLVDQVRIDHFRGFEAYWEIPADHPTAIGGAWKPGPGRALFDAVTEALGELPVIAEDLGVITPEVEALRDELGLPGMKILQFAFGEDAHNAYLPHNYPGPRCVVYTGTHDNDTTVGWYRAASDRAAHHVRIYLNVSGQEIAWDLLRAAWMSVAGLAIAPAQDVLSLGTEARMNTPGEADGNWAWRMAPGALTEELIQRLRYVTDLSGRLPEN